jgi:predicted nucleotidyltransferase
MLPLIEAHIEEIAQLCERYGLLRLELFGSACSMEFDPNHSDIDLLVEFANPALPGYADRYLGFADSMEALLGRSVDLVTISAIKNPYFKRNIDKCRTVIYERPGKVEAA